MINDIYLVGEDTTIHVYEEVNCVGIYDKESGVPKFVTEIDIVEEEDGLDRDWARDRNRQIENEVSKLREILEYNSTELKPERVEEIKDEIENLLIERDENTFKYGLAGKHFNRLYEEKKLKRTYGPNYKEAQFRKIAKQMLELYSKKNTDYGDSFAESLDEDGLLVSKIRMGDKYKRFGQLIENDALVDDETMRDTLIDLANYTVMTLIWLDENE